jgi:WD40 repeat protein
MAQWLGISSFSILDRASGALVYPKQAIQVSAPNGMAFSPDGTYLAVAGPGSVTLLNTASNETSTTISAEEVSTLTVSGRSVISLAFLPDGSTLVIGTDDGAILLWDLSLLSASADRQSMIDVACSQIRQNFTEAEWIQYVSSNSERQATCPNAPLP